MVSGVSVSVNPNAERVETALRDAFTSQLPIDALRSIISDFLCTPPPPDTAVVIDCGADSTRGGYACDLESLIVIPSHDPYHTGGGGDNTPAPAFHTSKQLLGVRFKVIESLMYV